MAVQLRSLVLVAAAVAAVTAGVATAQEAPDRHFLWRVTADNGTQLHLLGSVHAMNDDIYPLAPVIEEAYAEAELMVFEVDLHELQRAAMTMLSRGTLPAGTTLDQVVSPELFAKTVAELAKAGLPRSGFVQMRPWMLALTLTSLELAKNGFRADNGVDLHYFSRATADGKEIRGLEDVDFQIGLFAALSDEQSEAFLRYSLDEMQMVLPLMHEVTGHWQAGRTQELEKLLSAAFTDYPELYTTIVSDRNLQWLAQVEKLMQERRKAMVVVGSLHLVGEHSLVSQLAAKGYKVEQR